MRVTIVLHDGEVTSVLCDEADVEVTIHDYDQCESPKDHLELDQRIEDLEEKEGFIDLLA